jgi:cellulose biosynthesis protein BcsQ
MAKKITLFNNKGGVGKTTLTVNIADALDDLGYTVLMVDADPQCNLTSFFLPEDKLDALLGESGDDEGGTVWSSIKPVVLGRGPTQEIELIKLSRGMFLAPGDVLLADYEEELPGAWTDSFARKERGYDVMGALSHAVNRMADSCRADIVMYDVGPNVGPLNRAILLDVDHFVSPVAADLFSLRALATVGRSLSRWIRDWKTIRDLSPAQDKVGLLSGHPEYIGYITSAYKISSGRNSTAPHERWEQLIAPRVQDRIVAELRKVDASLVPQQENKVGGIKNFHSLAPQAQSLGIAIGQLKGQVNSGYNPQVADAKAEFAALASEIAKRIGLAPPVHRNQARRNGI